MKRHVRALLAVALCFLALWAGGFASAQDRQNRAGLVIEYGDGAVTYAIVPFDESTISGIQLLELSGVPLVTVEFGGLGDAVCTIGERGCGVGDCRQRVCQSADPDSPFWQYFRLTDGKTWTPLILGASSAQVENGSIEGWSWTGTEPRLPVVELDEIEAILGIDDAGSDRSEVRLRTFDAGVQVLDSEPARSSSLSYIAAVAVIVVLAGVAAQQLIRRKSGADSR